MHAAGERVRHAASPDRFVALDFETATCDSDSACALGVVVVEDYRIVRRRRWLMRPPSRHFEFTYVHGITWRMVANEPTFAELWPEIRGEVQGAQFIAAHYAPFDRDVLDACCRRAGLRQPRAPFLCTVQLARRAWGIYPTKLPNVCALLGIDLDHHEALSDAQACARIVIAAGRTHVSAELGRHAGPAGFPVASAAGRSGA
jgi:DNA polymerase III subunit epsilon